MRERRSASAPAMIAVIMVWWWWRCSIHSLGRATNSISTQYNERNRGMSDHVHPRPSASGMWSDDHDHPLQVQSIPDFPCRFFLPRRQFFISSRIPRVSHRTIGAPLLLQLHQKTCATPSFMIMFIPSLRGCPPRRPLRPKPSLLLFLLLDPLGRCFQLREPPKPNPYVARTHEPPPDSKAATCP